MCLLAVVNTSYSIDHRIQAIFLVDAELEKLNLCEFENLTSYTEDLSKGFTKEVVVEEIPNGKKITVTVSYPEGEVKLDTEKYQ